MDTTRRGPGPVAAAKRESIMKRPSGIVLLVVVLLGCTTPTNDPLLAQHAPPITGSWSYHPSPEAAGWNPALLEAARPHHVTWVLAQGDDALADLAVAGELAGAAADQSEDQ